MTTPWNEFGSQTAVQDPQQQAWQQAPAQPAAYQQAPYQPAAPYQQFPQAQPQPQYNQAGGMPPQGPANGGYQGFQPPAPKNKMPMIIAIVVAAVLLIGGGVTAFFLLNKDDKTTPAPAPDNGSSVIDAPSSNDIDPTVDIDPTSDEPTQDEPTKDQPTKTSTPSEPTEEDPVEDPTSSGDGDMATAENLVVNWLGFINEGDYTTASELICEAEKQDFIDGFDGVEAANQLEAVDMQYDGDNIALTIGAVGDTTGDSYLNLTMWPTDTGYFLICSGPLSDADLNW